MEGQGAAPLGVRVPPARTAPLPPSSTWRPLPELCGVLVERRITEPWPTRRSNSPTGAFRFLAPMSQVAGKMAVPTRRGRFCSGSGGAAWESLLGASPAQSHGRHRDRGRRGGGHSTRRKVRLRLGAEVGDHRRQPRHGVSSPSTTSSRRQGWSPLCPTAGTSGRQPRRATCWWAPCSSRGPGAPRLVDRELLRGMKPRERLRSTCHRPGRHQRDEPCHESHRPRCTRRKALSTTACPTSPARWPHDEHLRPDQHSCTLAPYCRKLASGDLAARPALRRGAGEGRQHLGRGRSPACPSPRPVGMTYNAV